MPTALELSPKGWKRYLEAAQRRPVVPVTTPDEQREREQLLEQVRQAAALVKTRFGAWRVILFGSLAHVAWFRPDSDVDLAVEGLKGDAYWQAWRLFEELLDRPVDLIAIETAGKSLRQAIQRYGIDLLRFESHKPALSSTMSLRGQHETP